MLLPLGSAVVEHAARRIARYQVEADMHGAIWTCMELYIQVTLVTTDDPGCTIRARKPSNGRRMSGRPVGY